tara:strand:+ start:5724 stop:7601 length:1878 start_codon:yes stop_codon:yes gene_type:complete
MAQFYWRGNTSEGGRTIQGITGTVCFLPPGATSGNFDVCNWNVADNWLKVVNGPTHGSSADFHFDRATTCPGGGDEAIFDVLAQDNGRGLDTPIPLSRCIFGGFWNEKSGFGWVNAGQTSGKCSVHIKENFGDSNIVETIFGVSVIDAAYYPPHGGRTDTQYTGHIGPIGPWVGTRAEGANDERNALVGASAGLGSTYGGGVNMGSIINGLRLNSDSVVCEGGALTEQPSPYGSGADIDADRTWESGVPHGARFTDSVVDYCSLTAWRGPNIYHLDGGTYGQIEQNCPVDPLRRGPDGAGANQPNGAGSPRHDTMVDVFAGPDRSTYSQISHTPNFNITQSLYVGNTNIIGVGGYASGIANFELSNELPNFTYDSDFRHAVYSTNINANIANAHIYPERRSSRSKLNSSYTSLTFSGYDHGSTAVAGSERTITTLNMYDSAPGSTTRNVFERGENEEFLSEYGDAKQSNSFKIRGSNNLVGLDNASWTVTTLNLEGGRLHPGQMVLRNWDDSYSQDPYTDPSNTCNLSPENEILILGGDIFAKGAINTRCSYSPDWKGFKIGGATLAPNTGAGLKIASRNVGDSDDQFVTGRETRIAVDYLVGNTGATFSSKPTKPIKPVAVRRK